MEYKISNKPWLTGASIDFLEDTLRTGNKKVLELGSGASTIWFATRTNNLVSFEHDIRWYELVRKKLQDLNLEVDYRLFKGSYFTEIGKFPDNFFDLVLVDGKDRIECIKNSVRILRSGGILMLDDAQRDRYKVVNEILKNWQFFETQDYDEEKKEYFKTNWWIKPGK